MRLLRLLCCLGSCVALAGCYGAGASNGDIAPVAAPAPAPAVAPDAGMQAHAHASANATAGAAADAAPAAASAKPKRKGKGKSGDDDAKSGGDSKSGDDSKDEWWKDGPVTRDKVAAMCWMKFEKGRKDLPLEKRADLVNACVDQALKEHPAN